MSKRNRLEVAWYVLLLNMFRGNDRKMAFPALIQYPTDYNQRVISDNDIDPDIS